MKKQTLTVLGLLLITVALPAIVQSQERSRLTDEQQKKFLASRLPSGAITGTFNEFGSFLAAIGIVVHTTDSEIGRTALHSPFPEFYKPTIREFLDAIASQTGSSWCYDSSSGFWVFAKPACQKPFSITVSDKWTVTDRGIYVSYKPPTHPVGMDIYYFGVYSSDKPSDEAALWTQVRNAWAIGFASNLKSDMSIAEMRKVTVDGAEALYFESAAPVAGLFWRQWALINNGRALVIVSTLPTGNQQLLKDVESMVKSFRFVEAKPTPRPEQQVAQVSAPTKSQSCGKYDPFDSSKSYTQKLHVLRRFIQLYGRPGVHRVFVARTNNGGDDKRSYVYAYWPEGHSILLLGIFDPLFDGTKEVTDYSWLEYKARINLRTDLVPTENDVGGSSYLTDKHWADHIIKTCVTSGRKISIYRRSQSPALGPSHGAND